MLREKDLYTESWKHSIPLGTVLKVGSFKYCRHIFRALCIIENRYNITQAGFINTGKIYVYNHRRGSQIILHVNVQTRSLVEVKPYIVIYHSIFNIVFKGCLLFQLSDV